MSQYSAPSCARTCLPRLPTPPYGSELRLISTPLTFLAGVGGRRLPPCLLPPSLPWLSLSHLWEGWMDGWWHGLKGQPGHLCTGRGSTKKCETPLSKTHWEPKDLQLAGPCWGPPSLRHVHLRGARPWLSRQEVPPGLHLCAGASSPPVHPETRSPGPAEKPPSD